MQFVYVQHTNDIVDGDIEIRKSQLLNDWYTQLANNGTNYFKIGDLVLARWQDDQYYLAKILDVEIKTKFGTKAKHFKIKYLYDDVRDIVVETKIKTATLQDVEALNLLLDEESMNKRNSRKAVLKRKSPFNLLSEESNDNVFYDEKTKNFTESCRLRRQRLSFESDGLDASKSPTIIDKSEPTDVKRQVFPKKRRLNNISNQTSIQQRHSSRKRKCCLRNSDYFYPDSFDQIFTDKVNDTTEEESTKLTELCVPIHSVDSVIKSDDKYSVGQENENIQSFSKESETTFFNSPEIDSYSSEITPIKKLINESVEEIEESSVETSLIKMFSATEDGQFRCNTCHNKSFRKKQLVLDHIKHYHQNQNSSQTSNENMFNKSPRPMKKINKTKKYIPNLYSARLNRTTFSEPHIRKSFKNSWKESSNRTNFPSSKTNISKNKLENNSTSKFRKQIKPNTNRPRFTSSPSQIVYCNRCKKSTDDPPDMLQCHVCLCWSHKSCYGLLDDSDTTLTFWECDNCLGTQLTASSPLSSSCSSSFIDSTRAQRQEIYFRDKWRFNHVPNNDFSSLTTADVNSGNYNNNSTKNSSSSGDDYRNLCEMESILSVCNRILEAIMRNLDRLNFKSNNDSNSQDELDILKSFSIDPAQINKLDLLECPEVTEDMTLFKESILAPSILSAPCTTNANIKTTSLNLPLPLSTPTPLVTINSPPSKLSEIDNALNNVTNHDLFLQFSSEINNLPNSTPNKQQTIQQHQQNQQSSQQTPTSANKLLNNSLDTLLECDINLDIIPNAEFDALVKDLSNCEEIVNKTQKITTTSNNKIIPTSNGTHKLLINSNFSQDDDYIQVSKSSNLLMDLIEAVEAAEKNNHSSSFVSTSNNVSLSTSIALLNKSNNSHNTSMPNETSIIDFLMEKDSQCGNLVSDLLQDEQKSEMKEECKLNSDNLISSCVLPCSAISSGMYCNFSNSPLKLSSSLISQPTLSSIYNNPLPSIPCTASSQSYHHQSSSSSSYNSPIITNQLQTSTDNKLLKWLINKYYCVEKVVDTITQIVNNSQSQILNNNKISNEYKRIRRYLSSVLFVLQRNNE